jgi:hypothetical protein
VSLILTEVIAVSVEALTQMHAADRARLDAQSATFAFFPMHFDPAPILLFFSFSWHVAVASRVFAEPNA